LPFGAFPYGFNTDESYGYLGGQSFAPVALSESISITPEEDTAFYHTNQCWQAIVRDEFNNPVPGVRVNFHTTGVNAGVIGFSNTNYDGIATFCYTGDNGGLDSVYASIVFLSDTAKFHWFIGPVRMNVKLYLEGFYSGGGMMNNAGAGGCLFVSNIPGAQMTDADTVLISAVNPVTLKL
jgi:hypothetical protein